MTRISIALEEPTLTTLLHYYGRQFPTHAYAVGLAGLVLLQVLAEILALMPRLTSVAWRPAHMLTNAILALAFCIAGGLTIYTLLLTDSPRLLAYWVGIGMFTCAFIGRELTYSTLKPHYSSYLEMARHERVVVSGIFALIRYPLAALYLAEMAAFPIMAWHPGSAMILALAGFGILWKVRAEDQRLTVAVGEYFAVYRQTTKRILPFLD